MKYTYWLLRRKLAYTKYTIQVTALVLFEDIKDYICEGRELKSKDKDKHARGQ